MLAVLLLELGSILAPSDSSNWRLQPTLPRSVRYSEYVVLATFEAVPGAPTDDDTDVVTCAFGVPFEVGELDVEQWLKGTEQTEPLQFLNHRCLGCEGADVELGQRSLWFLRRLPADANLIYRADVKALDRDEKLLDTVFAGRGRLDVEVRDGRAFALVHRSKLGLRDVPLEEPCPGREYLNPVALTWIQENVATIVRQQRAPYLRLEAKAGEAGVPWQLVLNGDRSASLTIRRPDGDEAREYRIDADTAWRIDFLLDQTKYFEGVPDLGAPNSKSWDRTLTLFAGTAERAFRVGDLVGADNRSREARAAELWAALRSSFDCPECIDHRAADRKALERR